MKKSFCVIVLFILTALVAEISVAREHLNPVCSAHGAVPGGRACAYSLISVVVGDVPEGNIILTGYLKKYQKSIYLFMNRDSAASNVFSEAVEIKSIDDQVFKKHPELFVNKIVTVVGIFSKKTRIPDPSFYSTAGSVDVKAINYWKDKSASPGH